MRSMGTHSKADAHLSCLSGALIKALIKADALLSCLSGALINALIKADALCLSRSLKALLRRY